MVPIVSNEGTIKQCREVAKAFPPQHQDRQPGMEYRMDPRPVSENPAVRGSGKLRGKTAFISGGDSGIGRAVAYAFAREGADVAVSYLDEHRDAAETRRRIEELGGRCLLLPADLRHSSEARRVIEATLDRFGRIDVLVNNHGVQFVRDSLLDISDEQFDNTFRTNIYGYFYLIRAALPYLEEGSSIINTTSITAYQGAGRLIDYSASKGAIVSLTRSLAKSLAKQGVRVNAVAPGPVWTPLQPSSYPAEDIVTFGADTPMGRAGQPFEMAEGYVYLACDDSSFMTGQVLHIDGGSFGYS